jgi:hypothetical protein
MDTVLIPLKNKCREFVCSLTGKEVPRRKPSAKSILYHVLNTHRKRRGEHHYSERETAFRKKAYHRRA